MPYCIFSQGCFSSCPQTAAAFAHLSHVLFCVFILAWDTVEALQEPVHG